MTGRRGQDVRTTSIRVALAAAAVVGIAYLVVAVAVVVIVTNNLTAQIDGRLTGSLAGIAHEPPPPAGGFGAPAPERPFGAPLIVWTIHPDGDVTCNTSGAVLPDSYRTVTTPRTVTINNTDVRIAGGPAGDQYVVVGQTTESVSQARSTVILAESIIGPVLLVLVFVGAVVIGRRVAAPIERARQRQLEFTADASHELRTPLSVIEAQTSLALTQPRSEAWYRTAFERVERENRRIRRLVDDMLWLARFDASQGHPFAEPVDVGVMAEQAVDRFAVVAEARHLTLSVRPAQDSSVVLAPPEWLDRLLGVLLDNACRYAPEGGVVDVSVTHEAGRVRLAVDDSGPGIPEAERARIFDRFHRASDAPGGSGLGLAIGDAIVRATGGRWKIGTAAGGGASMAVTWSRALAGAGRAQGAGEGTATAPPARSASTEAGTGSSPSGLSR